ncbi:MAG: putative Prephenate dehydratase [Candidatus Saccharibacteria bacterium]|nr:putative Prephenate dehydratase [Candidatus Saccharibacteria bacterium]
MQNNTITVAIQGDRASFHEIAAMRYYKQPVTLVYCQSFEETFSKLASGEVDKIFVAVSNSNHGEIHEVKMLLDNNDLTTEGEYLLPIEQHIIGLPLTDLSKVRKIISHPVALSQCSEYLAKRFADVELENYHDTSAAVALVKQQSDSSLVAVGSERAADIHGLVILCRAIQDDLNNATLFKSLSKK